MNIGGKVRKIFSNIYSATSDIDNREFGVFGTEFEARADFESTIEYQGIL